MIFTLILIIILISSQCVAFKTLTLRKISDNKKITSNKQLNLSHLMETSTLIQSLIQKVPADQARGEFIFFFLAGGGALGFGVTLIPKLFSQYGEFRSLAGGDSEGGENLNIGLPGLFYPEPLKRKDVQNIIDKIPSVKILADNGPKLSFIAKQGYIEREGFVKSLPKKSNPLSLYAG